MNRFSESKTEASHRLNRSYLRASARYASHPRGHFVDGRHSSGLTLVEVMIAVLIFAVLMGGALTAVVQTRRMAEDNIGMAVARTVAQGIIEQARLENSVIRLPGATTLPLRFIGDDVNNFAAISQRDIPIAPDASEWTAVGALSDPNDPNSEVLGVLLDVEHRDASGNQIRPSRFMDMEVNFQITFNDPIQRYFVVELRYRWKSPVRNANASAPEWLTKEIRTAIAYMSTS